MTTEQIVKALRVCGESRLCNECPSYELKDTMGVYPCADLLMMKAAVLIEQQAARIAELEAKVPRWIPVTERLPETAGSYIVCTKSGSVAKVNFYPELGRSQRIFTHWMPLPEPPETDGGGEDG